MLDLPTYEADIEAEGVLTTSAALAALRPQEDGGDGQISISPLGECRSSCDGRPMVLLRKIDKTESPCALQRRNFTFAHEIGHYVLRQRVGWSTEDYPVDPVEEFLCNQFAEELLMPETRFTDDLAKCGVGPGAFLYLQKCYDISLQALVARVSGLFRGGVVGMLWCSGDSGAPVVTWAGPRKYSRSVVYAAGESPIDAAFASSELQEGRCEVLLGMSRSWWDVGALRLSSNKILSIFRADLKRLHRYMPVPESLEFRSDLISPVDAANDCPQGLAVASSAPLRNHAPSNWL
ncbi:MAG TPA: ImmA/IrrE family metallo-endopeptidase [Bryobacteraceae bacterium]|jgi:hypothetical protein